MFFGNDYRKKKEERESSLRKNERLLWTRMVHSELFDELRNLQISFEMILATIPTESGCIDNLCKDYHLCIWQRQHVSNEIQMDFERWNHKIVSKILIIIFQYLSIYYSVYLNLYDPSPISWKRKLISHERN